MHPIGFRVYGVNIMTNAPWGIRFKRPAQMVLSEGFVVGLLMFDPMLAQALRTLVLRLLGPTTILYKVARLFSYFEP